MTHYPFSMSLSGGKKRLVISTTFQACDKKVYKRHELGTQGDSESAAMRQFHLSQAAGPLILCPWCISPSTCLGIPDPGPLGEKHCRPFPCVCPALSVVSNSPGHMLSEFVAVEQVQADNWVEHSKQVREGDSRDLKVA